MSLHMNDPSCTHDANMSSRYRTAHTRCSSLSAKIFNITLGHKQYSCINFWRKNRVFTWNISVGWGSLPDADVSGTYGWRAHIHHFPPLWKRFHTVCCTFTSFLLVRRVMILHLTNMQLQYAHAVSQNVYLYARARVWSGWVLFGQLLRGESLVPCDLLFLQLLLDQSNQRSLPGDPQDGICCSWSWLWTLVTLLVGLILIMTCWIVGESPYISWLSFRSCEAVNGAW